MIVATRTSGIGDSAMTASKGLNTSIATPIPNIVIRDINPLTRPDWRNRERESTSTVSRVMTWPPCSFSKYGRENPSTCLKLRTLTPYCTDSEPFALNKD